MYYSLEPKCEQGSVRYKNRYGMELAGELSIAKDLNRTDKHPALIVGAPNGGVKGQGPCVYANELAQQGFVVLTFDQSFMGESGEEPRHVSSPAGFCRRDLSSPILLVVGDRAHSKFFSQNVYTKANEPKELYIVKDAEHIDLYDRTDRIPFVKLTGFFQANLK